MPEGVWGGCRRRVPSAVRPPVKPHRTHDAERVHHHLLPQLLQSDAGGDEAAGSSDARTATRRRHVDSRPPARKLASPTQLQRNVSEVGCLHCAEL